MMWHKQALSFVLSDSNYSILISLIKTAYLVISALYYKCEVFKRHFGLLLRAKTSILDDLMLYKLKYETYI